MSINYRRIFSNQLHTVVLLLLVAISMIFAMQKFFAIFDIRLKSIKFKIAKNKSIESLPTLIDDSGRLLPDAIIIGSRKCGTRALVKFLQVNRFVSAAKREVHFFDENYDKGFEWYRQQMPRVNDKKQLVTIEKSPAYFVTSEVPERIKTMNSSIKLVLVLRNPVTRLVSDYSQLSANRIEHQIAVWNQTKSLNTTQIDALWKKESLDFEAHVLRLDGGVDEHRKSVRNGMYAIHLERWRQSFPMNQIHIVDGEALIINPAKELNKLEHFLDLPIQIKEQNFVFVKQKGFFCIVSTQNQNKDEPVCLNKQKGRRHVKVSQELREKLNKFYVPYNEYLYSITGINYNWNN